MKYYVSRHEYINIKQGNDFAALLHKDKTGKARYAVDIAILANCHACDREFILEEKNEHVDEYVALTQEERLMGYHDNEKTTKRAVADAVGFINDRERYKYLCQILMDHFGFNDYKITDMLMKARNCQFEDIKIALVSEISNCYDDVDLMRDEFKRIKVISKSSEIDGLCDRALARSKRITPVIDEINELKKQREQLEQWIAAVADDHKQIPDWMKQSARSLLASCAT